MPFGGSADRAHRGVGSGRAADPSFDGRRTPRAPVQRHLVPPRGSKALASPAALRLQSAALDARLLRPPRAPQAFHAEITGSIQAAGRYRHGDGRVRLGGRTVYRKGRGAFVDLRATPRRQTDQLRRALVSSGAAMPRPFAADMQQRRALACEWRASRPPTVKRWHPAGRSPKLRAPCGSAPKRSSPRS